jgi:hypothetical protein
VSVRIISDNEQSVAVLYCSTTDWCFGPVIHEDPAFDKSATERAEAFLEWYAPNDVRTLTDAVLSDVFTRWQAQEADQYAQDRLRTLLHDEEEGVLLDHDVAELATLRVRYPHVD